MYCFTWLPWISTGNSRQEVFPEVKLNQKTSKLYTSSAHWKNQRRSIVRKHALLWNKRECNILLIFLSKLSLVIHFLALVSFNTPWNTSENHRSPYVLRVHRKRPVAWNGLQVSANLSFRNNHWSSALWNDIMVDFITFSEEIINYDQKKLQLYKLSSVTYFVTHVSNGR